MPEIKFMVTQIRKTAVIVFGSILSFAGFSQKVKYSAIEREDARQMNFEVIGKQNNNIIVYKNFRSDNYFSIYDEDMKLVDKVKLVSIPNKLINVDFVAYPGHFYMIYQHQKKSVIYCEAIKFDNKGKKLEEVQTLDTTTIPLFQNDNKIYQVLVSDDKQKIAVIKANKKNERNHQFAAILFNQKLEQQYKRRHGIAMDGKNNFLDEFVLDNDGNIYMAKCYSNNGNEYVNKLDMLYLPAVSDTMMAYLVSSNDRILDEIKLKFDNISKRVIIQSFYFTKRKGNVEGLYVNFFDKNNPTVSNPNFIIFADSLRIAAKVVGSSKLAFNEYFIRQIYPRKDGGFIMAAESYFTTTRGGGGNPWNRFDYFSSTPYLTSYDYYNMGGRSWYWNSWNRYESNVTYNAENIAVFSCNNKGNLEWSNIIDKNQRDENVEDYVSYQVLLTGGQLHFLYNDKDRNDFLMFDNSITSAGQVTRHPTLKNLNRQYTIMVRHGKQISAKEMIFPCVYKNYICFAKIEY